MKITIQVKALVIAFRIHIKSSYIFARIVKETVRTPRTIVDKSTQIDLDDCKKVNTLISDIFKEF